MDSAMRMEDVMSSCGSLLYNPSNKAEQVTVIIKQPIK